MNLTFSDGQSLAFTSDQQDARSYVGADGSVIGRVLSRGQSNYVWQLCGGDTNGLYVRATHVPDHSSWMGNLVVQKPDVALNQLVLPGSHDAGMYTITANWALGGGDEWAQTQTLPFSGQLAAGSRYFDVRVYMYRGKLITGHGTGSYGAYGGYLSEIIADVKAFLCSPAGKNEAVILKFSHTYYTDTASLKSVVDEVKTLGSLLYTTTDPRANLATTRLHALAGKVVAVFDVEFKDFWNMPEGILPYHDEPIEARPAGDTRAAGMTVYDHYANDNAYEDMLGDQRDKLDKYAGWGSNYLFLLSWTLSGTSKDKDLRVLAGKANPWLAADLAKLWTRTFNGVQRKPNVVYVDYLDAYLCGGIIAMNQLP